MMSQVAALIHDFDETGDIATYQIVASRDAAAGPSRSRFFMREDKGESARATLPLFLVGFAVLVVLNSIGLLPKMAIDLANDVSRWCVVAAIAALGMKTSFKALFAVGWRPVGHDRETLWRWPGLVFGQNDHLRLVRRASWRFDAAFDRKHAFPAERKLCRRRR
jgi:hypothetical protein